MISTEKGQYPWLKHYAPNVPYEINPEAYNSLLDSVDSNCIKYADRAAYANMGKILTFHDIDIQSKKFAAYLQSIGMQKGDRIAIQLPNLLQYPIVMFGAIRAGLIVVNVNPLYTSREMLHQFKDSGVKAIVILANFASNLEPILSQTDIQHIITTQIGDMLGFPKKLIVNAVVKYIKKMVPAYHLPTATTFAQALSIGAQSTYQKPDIKLDDTAFIQYTGGTTGVSKGAMLTNRNLIANVEMNAAWLGPMIQEIKDPVFIAALPLYHVYALTVNALAALKCGGMNVLITNPRDMDAFINDLKKYQINIFTGVNTLFNALVNHPRVGEVDFSQLRVTSAGGMALQRKVSENWLKTTGCIAVEGYGLSETSPVLSSNVINGKNKIGTIGIPWPSTQMRILRDDQTWAAVGEIGEICAAGPQIMAGYYNKPEETEKCIFTDQDGRWFKTGDVGSMDEDGFFKIVDRKKDMIIVSGFNVYPNEIEEVVSQCPGVLEVACIGVPSDKTGESVKVFVVKKELHLTEEAIKAFCKKNLTAYKCPKIVEFRNELPKSNVGKILRKDLKLEEAKKLK